MVIPSATYRIQLNQSFTFNDLKEILSYLEALGISTVYAAPIAAAVPASMHGYDVTDPHTVNPEIGTIESLREINAIIRGKGMSWLQDIVPNHMAFSPYNSRLMDVLERGPSSPYYTYFDIDWNHHEPQLNGRVMVPFLGKELPECLEAGEIKLSFSDQGFTINYYDAHYPLSLNGYSWLQNWIIARKLGNEWGERLALFVTQAKATRNLPRWKELKQRWINDCKAGASADQLVNTVNADKRAFIALLEQQFYILTFWKDTEQRINYRRFFTVSSLICLNMQSEEVFAEYHEFLHDLYGNNIIQGLRIDHIDGLNDPSQYIKRLRKLFGESCYIVAEKILEAKEDMPEQWPLQGTSGYEYLSMVNQLFTNRKGAITLEHFYQSLVPEMPPYDVLVQQNKKLILEKHMAGELANIVHYLFALGLDDSHPYDRMKEALSLIMLCLPVYRIYPEQLPLEGMNLTLITEAFNKARRTDAGYSMELEYLFNLFTGPPAGQEQHKNILLFLKRLMQFTGPLTAKGVEDTTFYVYNPLISHDEVGDAPSKLGISIHTFHLKMMKRQQNSPLSLNATATHDTKRGEDARIRLNILSEMPEDWTAHVKQWYVLNAEFKKTVNNAPAPSRNDEYFIYQSLVGGFPEDFRVTDQYIERLQEYLVKVVREAKVMSNWEVPNDAYETSCTTFINAILDPGHTFLASFIPFIKAVSGRAQVYSMAQVLIKVTTPGVPDIYQGCELYDLSYVDPDNRRPVDYGKRRELLQNIESLEKQGVENLFRWIDEHAHEGVGKLYITWKTLNFRKKHPALFSEGTYIPLEAQGTFLAFARQHGSEWLIVVVPFGDFPKKTFSSIEFDNIFISLPLGCPTKWFNILTRESLQVLGERIAVRQILDSFPLAILSTEQVE